MNATHQALTQAYKHILSTLPLHWLDRSQSHTPEFAKLSGLFLPGASQAYEQASRRIMVVGRETRRWNITNNEVPFIDLDEYIQRAMAKQQACLTQYMSKPKDKGASFLTCFVRWPPIMGMRVSPGPIYSVLPGMENRRCVGRNTVNLRRSLCSY